MPCRPGKTGVTIDGLSQIVIARSSSFRGAYETISYRMVFDVGAFRHDRSRVAIRAGEH